MEIIYDIATDRARTWLEQMKSTLVEDIEDSVARGGGSDTTLLQRLRKVGFSSMADVRAANAREFLFRLGRSEFGEDMRESLKWSELVRVEYDADRQGAWLHVRETRGGDSSRTRARIEGGTWRLALDEE